MKVPVKTTVSKDGKPLDMAAALSAFDSGLSPEEQQAKLQGLMGRTKTRAAPSPSALRRATCAC